MDTPRAEGGAEGDVPRAAAAKTDTAAVDDVADVISVAAAPHGDASTAATPRPGDTGTTGGGPASARAPGSAAGSVSGKAPAVHDLGRGQGDARARPPGPFEDCYPPRREDEVQLLRRRRDEGYQLDLLRQIEEKKRAAQQRRRDEIRADLLRLGGADRHEEYVQRLHDEQQRQLREQMRHQLRREEQREAQRMRQVEQTRERQREHVRGHAAAGAGPDVGHGDAGAAPDHDSDQRLDQLAEALERQRLEEDPQPPTRPPSTARNKADAERKPASTGTRLEAAEELEPAAPKDLTTGVVDQVKLDDRKPWNHYRALQRELLRRRREHAAMEAAREAAAARHAAAAARSGLEDECRRQLDRRLRARRPPEASGAAAVLGPRSWAEAARQASLSPRRRAERDCRLAEWRRAKLEEDKGRRAAAAAVQAAAREAAAERQRRASESFARWLNTIHDRRLAENAGPVGATGVTTYEAFHAAPWNRTQGGRRKPVA